MNVQTCEQTLVRVKMWFMVTGAYRSPWDRAGEMQSPCHCIESGLLWAVRGIGGVLGAWEDTSVMHVILEIMTMDPPVAPYLRWGLSPRSIWLSIEEARL